MTDLELFVKLVSLVKELDLALRVSTYEHQMWQEDLQVLKDAEARIKELNDAAD